MRVEAAEGGLECRPDRFEPASPPQFSNPTRRSDFIGVLCIYLRVNKNGRGERGGPRRQFQWFHALSCSRYTRLAVTT